MGLRVRTYCPVGDLVAGMSYLVRRLLENTSNDSFLLSRARRGPRTPCWRRRELHQRTAARVTPCTRPRDARRRAGRARRAAPWRVPVIVAGERRDEPTLLSHDPGTPERIVAEATTATTADVDAAVRAAGVAAPAWEDRGAHARAAILSRAAGELRRRRATLAALAVRECAKPWAEADADVCEAIDFLEYYAQQAVALEAARTGSCSSRASATRCATPRAASSP